MGLGSQNKESKKQFIAVAGKNDWKETVKTVDDARYLINKLETSCGDTKEGRYLIAAYAHNKIKLLQQYIESKTTLTLKEYEKKS